MSTPQRPGYATVQMLRGIAASGVVFFHLLPFEHKYLAGAPIVPSGVVIGQAGVDVFFVISGFIVTITTAQRGVGAGPAIGFLGRRLLRIYPTYWVYFALLLVVYVAAPGLLNHGATEPPSLVASFLLLPSSAPPLLLVAWTLTFELYFYLVFALLIGGTSRHRLGWLLAVWSALIVAGRLLLPSPRSAPIDLMFNPLNLEFIAGCAVALWGPRGRPLLGLALAGIGLLGAVLMLRWLGMDAPFRNIWLRVAVMGGAATVMLAGVVAWENPGVTYVPRPLCRLGDASYSLYLSHLLTIGAAGLLWRWALRGESGMAAVPAVHVLAVTSSFALSVAVGWVSYRFIERRIAAGIKWRAGATRAAPEPASLRVSSVR